MLKGPTAFLLKAVKWCFRRGKKVCDCHSEMNGDILKECFLQLLNSLEEDCNNQPFYLGSTTVNYYFHPNDAQYHITKFITELTIRH